MRALLIAGLLLASAAHAEELTLDAVLGAVRASPARKAVAEKQEAWARAAAERDAASGPYRLELEAQDGPRDGGERQVGVTVSQSFKLGLDEAALQRQYAAEAGAQVAEVDAELTEQQRAVGRLYAELLHQRRALEAAEELERRLAPFAKTVKSATSGGTVSTLNAMRWRLLERRVLAGRDTARAGIAGTARSLAEATGLAIDPASVKPAAVPAQSGALAADSLKTPRLESLRRRQLALAGKAAAAGFTEIGAGVGLSRNLTDDKSYLVLRLDVPLGQGAATASAVRELDASRTALAAEEAIRAEALRREVALLSGDLRTREAMVKTATDLVDELRKTVDASTQGLARGVAEFPEVIEALASLYDGALDLSAKIKEHDEALVERRILIGDVANAPSPIRNGDAP